MCVGHFIRILTIRPVYKKGTIVNKLPVLLFKDDEI